MQTKLLWFCFIFLLLLYLGLVVFLLFPQGRPVSDQNQPIQKATPSISIQTVRLVNSLLPANTYINSRFFINLNTHNIFINSITFTLVYDKRKMKNITLFQEWNNSFAKQHIINQTNDTQGTIYYSIVNDNPSQPTANNADSAIAEIQLQNSVLPFSDSLTLKNISYTDLNNQTINIPDYTLPNIIIK